MLPRAALLLRGLVAVSTRIPVRRDQRDAPARASDHVVVSRRTLRHEGFEPPSPASPPSPSRWSPAERTPRKFTRGEQRAGVLGLLDQCPEIFNPLHGPRKGRLPRSPYFPASCALRGYLRLLASDVLQVRSGDRFILAPTFVQGSLCSAVAGVVVVSRQGGRLTIGSCVVLLTHRSRWSRSYFGRAPPRSADPGTMQ